MTNPTRTLLLVAALLPNLPGAVPAAASSATSTTVRIGLTTDPIKARVSADGGIVVRDPVRGEPIWKRRFAAGIYVVSDLEGGEAGLVYRVQVASYAARDQARASRKEVEEAVPGEKVVLVYNPDRRAWRVRAGEFRTREDASALVRRLRDAGYDELWVTAEGRAVEARRRIRLVDDRWHDFLTEHDRVLIDPVRPGALLRVGDRSYRGRIEARVDGAGNLRLINELDMEQYLRGVVPNEMGPGVYPELEALKAQAVAARTYIVANLGQFSEDGFDVCDSPHCQVYKGAGTEHPVTDLAVEQTRGLILTWEGRPINAMYTSTCGGHTEDGALVFETETGPYLKGVPCYPEAEAESRDLTGQRAEPVLLEDGAPIAEAVVLLERLGVVEPEALSPSLLKAPCGAREAERWTTFALGLVGKRPPDRGLSDPLLMHEFVTYLAAGLGWSEKMRLAVDERDVPYLLAFQDRAEVPAPARRPYLVLTLEGILTPFPDNTLRPTRRPSRGLLLRVLYRLLDYYDALERVEATYRGSAGEKILLDVDGEMRSLSVAPDVALFRSFRDVSYPAGEVPLTLGDQLLYRASSDGAIDYLNVTANQRGVSDDRYSATYRWEQRYSREELEKRIKAYVDIGRLKDIEVTRRGVSGRVVEVKILGSRGPFTIRGFRIRTALGVRENLFTVDRAYGADGEVRSFIFSGKGWGHGVGLCQVGAYGMALRGESFDAILRHYYTGAELTPYTASVDTSSPADHNPAITGRRPPTSPDSVR
ncbi:MAG: SpoIID/LytB domain-containing protein [Acidobacteriota bacterium]